MKKDIIKIAMFAFELVGLCMFVYFVVKGV